MSTMSNSNIKRMEEEKTNPVSFFSTIVNNNWHFYSSKTSLPAGSQWFQVHEGPSALSQIKIFKD